MYRNRNWIVPATSVVAMLMTASSASAAPSFWSNFYVSVFGGGAVGTGSVSAHGVGLGSEDPECGLFDSDFCSVTTYDMTGKVGSGVLGGLALGTMIAPNLRAEGELSFASLSGRSDWTQTTQWDPEAVDFQAPTTNIGHGTDSLTATFMFGNIWYDIPLGNQLTGYVGGGAGLAHVAGSFSGQTTADPTSNLSLSINSFAPAVQVGGGLTYQVMPNVTLDFGYRFKGALGLPVSKASSFDPGLVDTTHSSSMNLGVHVIQVGVTVALD